MEEAEEEFTDDEGPADRFWDNKTSSWQANDKLIAVWKKDEPRSLVTGVCSGAVESRWMVCCLARDKDLDLVDTW